MGAAAGIEAGNPIAITTDFSAISIVKLVDGLEKGIDSGKFFSYDGSILPW